MILSVEDERNDSMKWNIGLLEWNQELNIDIGMKIGSYLMNLNR